MTQRVQGAQASWKQHSGTGQPDPTQRAILPVFDGSDPDPAAPGLTYKVVAGAAAEVIVVQGRNLADLASVNVGTPVKVGGNGGAAPAVLTVVPTGNDVTITLDCTPCAPDDYWGLLLLDGDGNFYAAPSPIKVVDTP